MSWCVEAVQMLNDGGAEYSLSTSRYTVKPEERVRSLFPTSKSVTINEPHSGPSVALVQSVLVIDRRIRSRQPITNLSFVLTESHFLNRLSNVSGIHSQLVDVVGYWKSCQTRTITMTGSTQYYTNCFSRSRRLSTSWLGLGCPRIRETLWHRQRLWQRHTLAIHRSCESQHSRKCL